MSGFAVRAFRDDDGLALMDVHRRAILATSEEFYTLEQRQSWAHGIRPDFYAPKDGSVTEVAVASTDRPVAFCQSGADEILGLYVDPDWHDRGVGSALIVRAETMILARGHQVAKVKATTSARHFYESRGYRFIADFPHKTRGGLILPAIALEKPIVRRR